MQGVCAFAAHGIYQRPQYVDALGKGMHRHVALHTMQGHSRQQPRQSQEMVAVEMTKEDMVDAGKRYAVAAQLQLRALAAVDQHIVAPVCDKLGTGVVSQGRRGRATPKDGDIEIRHDANLRKILQIQPTSLQKSYKNRTFAPLRCNIWHYCYVLVIATAERSKVLN